jgi:hypothetical protein
MGKLAVTVKNDASGIVYINGDPNWDDQVLTVDGNPQMEIYPLNPGGETAVVGIEGDAGEMGVIFSTTTNSDYDGSGFYQLTIGRGDTGMLDVTDGGPYGSPTVSYTLHDRQPLSMTMVFVDAR